MTARNGKFGKTKENLQERTGWVILEWKKAGYFRI